MRKSSFFCFVRVLAFVTHGFMHLPSLLPVPEDCFHLVVFFALRIFLLTLSRAQPQLVLVPGEDLTPYRKASASVFNVLCEFGSASQKLGMDEVAHTPTRMCTKT